MRHSSPARPLSSTAAGRFDPALSIIAAKRSKKTGVRAVDRPVGTSRAIEVERVSKIFGAGEDEVRALDEVSVSIGKNEFFTLLGPSGCGKTTLLRLIAGFETPTAGASCWTEPISRPLPPYRRPVNTVFQNYALFPHLTVAGTSPSGSRCWGRPRRRDRPDGSEHARAGQAARAQEPAQPASSRAASSSGWRWRGRWRRGRRCCCWTSRCRRSTSSCARRCRSSSSGCSTRPASPSCS